MSDKLVKTTYSLTESMKNTIKEIAALNPLGFPTKEADVVRHCLLHDISLESYLEILKEKENVSR